MRWHEVTGETLAPVAPPTPPATSSCRSSARCPSTSTPPCRRGDFRILESYLRALRAAERFIYIENQFLWSPEIAAVLHDKLVNPPRPDFRLLLLLPAKPNTGADDTRGVLGELIDADDDARPAARLHPLRPLRSARRPGLHPREDRDHRRQWLTLGSANLNEHSLFNDTEMNVVIHDPELATRHGCGSGQSISSCPIERDPGRPDRGDRRALEADQHGPARAPRERPAADAPARAPPQRLEAVSPRARTCFGPPGGRMNRGG